MNESVARENGEIEQLAGQKVSLRHAPGFAGHVKIVERIVRSSNSVFVSVLVVLEAEKHFQSCLM